MNSNGKRLLGSKMKNYVWDSIMCKYVDNINPLDIMEMFPHGKETGQALYFAMHPCGNYWHLYINDWYGDRSTITIVEQNTSQYTDIAQAVKWLFRDMVTWLLARYPNDDYTLNCIDFIVEKNPELKERQFYKNEENFEE